MVRACYCIGMYGGLSPFDFHISWYMLKRREQTSPLMMQDFNVYLNGIWDHGSIAIDIHPPWWDGCMYWAHVYHGCYIMYMYIGVQY